MPFENLAVLPTAPPRRTRRRQRDTVSINGLEAAVALRVVMDRLEDLTQRSTANAKWQATQHFLADGCAKRQRPENFIAVEGIASALMALKIRASNSPLSEAEIALLEAEGIETETVTETADTIVINPAYMRHKKLLAKIEDALKTVPDIPEDAFLRQPGKTRHIVKQAALDKLFHLPPERAAPLLRIMTNLSITPVVEDADLPAYLRIIQDLLTKDAQQISDSKPAALKPPEMMLVRPGPKPAGRNWRATTAGSRRTRAVDTA